MSLAVVEETTPVLVPIGLDQQTTAIQRRDTFDIELARIPALESATQTKAVSLKAGEP